VAAVKDVFREPVEYNGNRYIPVSIDSIRVNSVPQFDLFLRVGPGQPMVLYCEHNTPFTVKARTQLENNRIKLFYVRSEEHAAYRLYLAENLDTILKDKDLSLKKKSVILYDCAQAVVEDVLTRPRSRESIVRGKDIVRQTVEFMTAENFLLEHLLRSISCDYYLYTHSVNVVAYTLALAMESGYTDRATLREVANGALLHDIGKSMLEPALLNKAGPLTPREWELLQTHPKSGYALLLEHGNLGEIALDIVLHHHEKLNGAGYPEKLPGDAISPFVRMVTIADIFDALTTDRFHEKAKSTFDALSMMLNTMSEDLDADLVRIFVEMMGSPTR